MTLLALAGEHATDTLRRALLIGFANRLARRMSQHNGYKTMNEHSTLAQLHPSTAPLSADEYGLTPEYLIYTSLVATARIFLNKVGTPFIAHISCWPHPLVLYPHLIGHTRALVSEPRSFSIPVLPFTMLSQGNRGHSRRLQVCPMEHEWVQHMLPKLWDIDVKRLSGGHTTELAVEKAEQAGHASESAGKKAGLVVPPRKNDPSSVDAARARYLARRGSKAK